MEARSLSNLNILASNPPQYPEKPGEDKQEPLALYISRVPGTRDVILSTSKPQLKNVTGEDIANSLYYVHLEMPSALGHITTDVPSYTDKENPSPTSIPRKPLPALPHENPFGDASENVQEVPKIDIPRTTVGRTRAATTNSHNDPRLFLPSSITSGEFHPLDAAPNDLPAHIRNAPARKPAGPRAIAPAKRSSLDGRPIEMSDDLLRSEYRPRYGIPVKSTEGNNSSRSPSPRKRSIFSAPSSADPFTLTLIRRDPSTGNQWNVGKISSHQVESSADQDEQLQGPFTIPLPGAAPETASSGSPPIDIMIENSGYAKFRRMPGKKSLEAFGLSKLAANAAEETSPVREDIGVFSRKVLMLYSKSWTSNLRDKFHRLEEQIANKGHARQNSDASVEPEPESTSLGQALPGMKPRGYVFTSPWDGKCDFRTGNGGRSVRCYHTLHDGQSGVYNPLAADHAVSVAKSASVAVSELRFNLPGSELFPGDNDVESKLRGHFAKLLKNDSSNGSEEHDGTVSPFELNIGSEKAGGGNRGTRAKLGKLLIYNDGLKMLDLVVAANLGVWWGAWERSF